MSYGPVSNDDLLQYYGFVERENPSDAYVLQDMGKWLREVCLSSYVADRTRIYLETIPGGDIFTETVLLQFICLRQKCAARLSVPCFFPKRRSRHPCEDDLNPPISRSPPAGCPARR